MARLSRYHKYNKKLPGRYLSELSPNSMPLADAKVHLARARLAFQKKLRRLDTQFKLADDNGNGLMPPKGIIKCLERADIVLPDKYVKKIIAQSQLPDPDPSPMKEGDVYWRVVIGHLKRIKFNPNDGLDEVEYRMMQERQVISESEAEILADYTGFRPLLSLSWAVPLSSVDAVASAATPPLSHRKWVDRQFP